MEVLFINFNQKICSALLTKEKAERRSGTYAKHLEQNSTLEHCYNLYQPLTTFTSLDDTPLFILFLSYIPLEQFSNLKGPS